ncbi:MAG TPA: NAD-dependent epimerase/dehydratase family protein [Lacipirellulaceae bacterium]|nr:NAD-dependent epimerase/dehydratase family protein [Lacipirellulaceae bacterium]
MTSLVTGATGFVGRHLLARLAEQAEPVRAMYRDEGRRQQYITHGETAICGDICDPTVMRDAVAGSDVIYHCAAAHSTSTPDEIRRTNLAAVETLLDATKAVAPKARIVLLSSLNVLGNNSFVAATEDSPRKITHDLHADLKTAAEVVAERAIGAGTDIVILRPGLIYGAGDLNFSKLARAIARGKLVYIGSCDNIVPVVHVDDVVQAMILAAHVSPVRSRVFNITDGSKATISDLVTGLATAVGAKPPTRVMRRILPRIAVSVFEMLGREGPITRSTLRFLSTSRYVDISRARKELGYEPRVNLKEGIAGCAAWLKASVATQAAT